MHTPQYIFGQNKQMHFMFGLGTCLCHYTLLHIWGNFGAKLTDCTSCDWEYNRAFPDISNKKLTF